MRPDEIEAVALLWHTGWLAGHAEIVPPALTALRGQDSFRDRLTASVPDCWIAERDGQLAGFIRIVGNELDQFYVAPALIGQGVAKSLMRAAEGQMQRLGIRDACLIASLGNDRAIRFYERQGWLNRGVQKAQVETAEGPFTLAVVHFEKRLD